MPEAEVKELDVKEEGRRVADPKFPVDVLLMMSPLSLKQMPMDSTNLHQVRSNGGNVEEIRSDEIEDKSLWGVVASSMVRRP